MEKRDDLDILFEEVNKKLFKLDNHEFAKYFDTIYNKGTTTVYQKNMSETKKFEQDWIKTVESYFPSIDKITRNPRSNLKYEEEITPIEKAKKINSQSVRHLAAHTHLIKDIDEEDNVTPKKILTVNAEMDLETYENRFIMTLINRLFLFVRNRYLIIKENVESFQKDHVFTESKFEIGDINATLKVDLLVKKDLEDKTINEHNFELLKRVEYLEGLIEGLKGSQFMRMMSKAHPVKPPIMKTNVILKNPDFKNAYTLWIYLDRYNLLTYDVDVKEKDILFDDEFNRHLEDLTLINFTTIVGDQLKRRDFFNIEKGYKEYTKHSNAQLRNCAEDYVSDPGMLQIEDTSVNEYFLNKYLELFEKSRQEYQYTGKFDDEESIRKALKRASEVMNSLYEGLFHFEQEKNVFTTLVKEKDVDKEYNEKKQLTKYSKAIREIKETDYNQQFRKERKLLKELDKVSRQVIKKREQEILDALDFKRIEEIKKEIEEKNKELEEIAQELAVIEDAKTLLDYEKESLEKMRNDSYSYVDREVKAFKEETARRIKEEKEKLERELDVLLDAVDVRRTQLEASKNTRKEKFNERLEKERNEILEKGEQEKNKIRDKALKDRDIQPDNIEIDERFRYKNILELRSMEEKSNREIEKYNKLIAKEDDHENLTKEEKIELKETINNANLKAQKEIEDYQKQIDKEIEDWEKNREKREAELKEKQALALELDSLNDAIDIKKTQLEASKDDRKVKFEKRLRQVEKDVQEETKQKKEQIKLEASKDIEINLDEDNKESLNDLRNNVLNLKNKVKEIEKEIKAQENYNVLTDDEIKEIENHKAKALVKQEKELDNYKKNLEEKLEKEKQSLLETLDYLNDVMDIKKTQLEASKDDRKRFLEQKEKQELLKQDAKIKAQKEQIKADASKQKEKQLAPLKAQQASKKKQIQEIEEETKQIEKGA